MSNDLSFHHCYSWILEWATFNDKSSSTISTHSISGCTRTGRNYPDEFSYESKTPAILQTVYRFWLKIVRNNYELSSRTVQTKWTMETKSGLWDEVDPCQRTMGIYAWSRCLADKFLVGRFALSRIKLTVARRCSSCLYIYAQYSYTYRISLRSASYINIDYRAFSNKLWCL